MWIRHFVKELLAKNSVTRPMKYIVTHSSPVSIGFYCNPYLLFNYGVCTALGVTL